MCKECCVELNIYLVQHKYVFHIFYSVFVVIQIGFSPQNLP